MFDSILELFFPKVCYACRSPFVQNEIVVCTECRHAFPLTQHIEMENNEMLKKFYGKLSVEHVSSLLYFHKKGIVQELIHHLKYKDKQEIGTFLGEWYAEELKTVHQKLRFDGIIPVPLHQKRLRERGYNQLTTFGQALSKTLQLPFYETILRRESYAITQTKKSFFERIDDPKTKFTVSFSETNHNKHFLLIDDVMTTGATLEQCGKALLSIPGTRISIACMAYTY
jgi:ComF family protein